MKWRIILGVVSATIVVICFLPTTTIWSSGAVPIEVTVTSISDAPIHTVSCEAFWNLERAEASYDYCLPPESMMYSKQVGPFDGKPISINVGNSSKEVKSPLWGCEHRRIQMKKLVVIVEFKSGERKAKMVDIPDTRQNRSVLVEFP